MMISAATRLTGLLGWPVSHSLSPQMHNAAFAAWGLDFIYLPLPVEPTALPEAIVGLKALRFAGANVTIPHKVAVMDCLDELDDSARQVGAVNTIIVRDNQAIGYNTDMLGFINSLTAAGVAVAGMNAVLLGAGGAARAVVAGLLAQGAVSVAIGARDVEKVTRFAGGFDLAGRVKGYDWRESAFNEAVSHGDIVINCTPLGMAPGLGEEPPLSWSKLKPSTVVCDLIYNPAETALLARARRLGHKTVNGAGMLAEQGMLAFELWTGIEAPREIYYETLNAALDQRG